MERTVTVIKPGRLERNAAGMILDARSTVTLVTTENGILIVDTGLADEAAAVREGLDKWDLCPDDVDIVINTHLHADHTGNNALFPAAMFLVHEAEGARDDATGRVRAVSGGYEPLAGIRLISTPGHTRGSMSVVVRAERTYVIAGDALPTLDNYRKWVPPGINYDPDRALESMRRIVDIADIVIPGHDQPFTVERTGPGPRPGRERQSSARHRGER